MLKLKLVLLALITVTCLTAPQTRADTLWCSAGRGDVYCTDSWANLPDLLKPTAFTLTGGLAGYSRYTHADAVRPGVLRRFAAVPVRFQALPVDPIIIERFRVHDDRTTGITTRTDTVWSRGGQPLLIQRGGVQ